MKTPRMRIICCKSSEAFCAWQPDPSYGFQALAAGPHRYWLWHGADWLGVADRMIPQPDGSRWSVLHDNASGWYHHFARLIDTARFLLKEKLRNE